MTVALVTGASGFLGLHLTQALVERGVRVRALVRSTSRLDHLTPLGVEIARGDVLDPASLQTAVAGTDQVYHTAAVVAFGGYDAAKLMEVNQRGTENMLAAALSARVKKVVHVSSVAAVGGTKEPTSIDETHQWTAADAARVYSRSKRVSEEAALSYCQKGLSVVCVNPSLILGPVDPGPSLGGARVLDFLHGRIPVYLRGGFGVVDVRDVAQGCLLAMERGQSGERYILSTANFTIKEFFDALSRLSGVKSPRFCAPGWLAYAVAGFMEAFARLRGRAPAITRELVKNRGRSYSFYHADKARSELGWNPRPVGETFTEMIQWFRDNHYA